MKNLGYRIRKEHKMVTKEEVSPVEAARRAAANFREARTVADYAEAVAAAKAAAKAVAAAKAAAEVAAEAAEADWEAAEAEWKAAEAAYWEAEREAASNRQ